MRFDLGKARGLRFAFGYIAIDNIFARYSSRIHNCIDDLGGVRPDPIFSAFR